MHGAIRIRFMNHLRKLVARFHDFTLRMGAVGVLEIIINNYKNKSNYVTEKKLF